mgnify:CR=1 FL=1
MRTLFLILTLLFGYAGSAFTGELPIPADQATIQFTTKLGVVTFLHQKHADLSFTECTTCHHTFKGEAGESIKPCHECHNKKGAESPAAKAAFHTRCIGCHEYTAEKGEQAGPLKKKCKLCHVK